MGDGNIPNATSRRDKRRERGRAREREHRRSSVVMEAGIPNLLIRTVSDPIDSPFAQAPSQPDQDFCSALSFRKPVCGGGGSTSPLSQSPRPLQLERKETSSKAARSSSSSSSMLQDWAVEEEEKKGAEESDRARERLLSLGIWSNAGQGGGFDAGEKREGGGAFGLGASPVGVSQG